MKDLLLGAIEKYRESMAASDRERDKGLTIAKGVQVQRDIPYGEHGRDNLLDMNRPREASGALPVIISVHGGGYFYGDKELYSFYCADLASRGFAVINFNYRLSPDAKFPSQLEDVNAAVRFVCDNAAEHRLDLNSVFITGDSAGAQLASQYCAMLTDESFAALYGFKLPDVKIRAAAFNCGLYDMFGPLCKTEWLMCFNYARARFLLRSKKLDVMKHINADFPPSFIASSYGDFLLPYAAPMHDALLSRGAESELHIYGERGSTDTGHVFMVNMRDEQGRLCRDEECAFFRAHTER